MSAQEACCSNPAVLEGWDEGHCTQAALSCSAEVVPLLEQVLAETAELGHSARFCCELRLVLEEALVNGLRHGNRYDPARQVVLSYRVTAEEVLAEIEDEGEGFDPGAVPDPTAEENLDRPSGRGLLLMQHFTTWLRYQGRGNRVTLCKRR